MKQWRSRSAGFIRSQQIWIFPVFKNNIFVASFVTKIYHIWRKHYKVEHTCQFWCLKYLSEKFTPMKNINKVERLISGSPMYTGIVLYMYIFLYIILTYTKYANKMFKSKAIFMHLEKHTVIPPVTLYSKTSSKWPLKSRQKKRP